MNFSGTNGFGAHFICHCEVRTSTSKLKRARLYASTRKIILGWEIISRSIGKEWVVFAEHSTEQQNKTSSLQMLLVMAVQLDGHPRLILIRKPWTTSLGIMSLKNRETVFKNCANATKLNRSVGYSGRQSYLTVITVSFLSQFYALAATSLVFSLPDSKNLRTERNFIIQIFRYPTNQVYTKRVHWLGQWSVRQ